MNDSAPVADTLTEADETRLFRSREYCKHLTRAAAKNFYHGLKLLPEPKRSAMFALYAYMRMIDDIADGDDGRPVESREQDLDRWRIQTQAALQGELPPESLGEDIWAAFGETARRHQIPFALFDHAIAGQRQDLRPVEPETFDQLHEYCYRVAGVVGLASICIWGYQGGAETESLAIARGVAFQLTNILRDLREDAARGRIYLPREDLVAMNLTERDILNGSGGARFGELMQFQVTRAESFFEKSHELEDRIDPDSRPTLMAMTEVYRNLLRKIAADPQRVLHERISLSMVSKLRIAWRAVRLARRAGGS